MIIDTDNIKSLSLADKLRLVEAIWDDLGESPEPFPLPEWVGREANRRSAEMQDPNVGISHEEVWRRVERRNG